MAEKHTKSKLKLNKSYAKGIQSEICSRGTPKRSQATLDYSDIKAEIGRSVVPAAVWWNSEQLPAVERLWALTLKSAVPYLENQHWDMVPDLPHPSALSPTALKLDEQHWCTFDEEVAPFPEPSPPSQRPSWSPSSSQQEPSSGTTCVPEPPNRQLSSNNSQSLNGKTTSSQALIRPCQAFCSWEEPAPSARASSVGRDKGRKGGKPEEESGPVHRKPLTNQLKVLASPVSLQREAEHREEVVEEGQRSASGDVGAAGGGGLQSCPMCLLVFPVGFTQMDCDSHLAQCLSEVNVDMTW